MKRFLSYRLQVEISDWSDVLIFSERMNEVLLETTHGRIIQAPDILKRAILRHCQLHLASYQTIFPFISLDEDIFEDSNHLPIYLHVKNFLDL